MSQRSSGGARGTCPCHPANEPFYRKLQTLKETSEANGKERQARSYAKAMLSVRRYPLALLTSHDAGALQGIGKSVMSIFEQTLEDDLQDSMALQRTTASDQREKSWRTAARTRFVKAYKRHTSFMSTAIAALSAPAPSGIRRSGAKWRKGALVRSAAPTPSQCAVIRKGRLTASVRRRLSSGGQPAVGSARWTLLVSLGLRARKAPDAALSRLDVERCAEELRPYVKKCSAAPWPASEALRREGLVEAEGLQLRLSASGRSLADSLVAKLKLPEAVRARLESGTKSGGNDESSGAELQLVPVQRDVAESPQHRSQQSSVCITSPAKRVPDNLSQLKFQGPDAARRAAARPVEQDASSPRPQKRQRGRALRPSLSAPADPSEPSTSSTSALARTLARAFSCPVPPLAASSSSHLAGRSSLGWDLVLLLDHREVGAGREHAARGALLADLRSRLGQEAAEVRQLPLGDMVWIWRHKLAGGTTVDYVAGYMIERKTFQDLSASIMDGRYDEQKIRLMDAPGMKGVIYLIEGGQPLFGAQGSSAASKPAKKVDGFQRIRGFGHRLINHRLPTSTLSTTACHTQLISGLHVLHTTSTAHTLAQCVAIHEALCRAGPPNPDVPSAGEALVTYAEFESRTRRSCHPHIFEAFGRMVRMIPNCGPEATEAIVDEFATPHAFATALQNNSDAELLRRFRARRGSSRAAVSAGLLATCRELFALES
eukprot:TRINITY_DN59738_c0_g1_i1.p1 TRINITY_DN59738_c0_g1~~TRINITY_DN59738_c0_g1_i1.p1  ORF type:complete len:717 (-),score=102.79 TRINITY_DN59738_c0_g1_i1:57-2207(-)